MSDEELKQKVAAFKMEIAGIDEIQMTDVIDAICQGKYIASPVYYFARMCKGLNAQKAIICVKGDEVSLEFKPAKGGELKVK